MIECSDEAVNSRFLVDVSPYSPHADRTDSNDTTSAAGGVAAGARPRAAPTGSFVPFTIILECSSGKGHAI